MSFHAITTRACDPIAVESGALPPLLWRDRLEDVWHNSLLTTQTSLTYYFASRLLSTSLIAYDGGATMRRRFLVSSLFLGASAPDPALVQMYQTILTPRQRSAARQLVSDQDSLPL